jgi:hypothetical protein
VLIRKELEEYQHGEVLSRRSFKTEYEENRQMLSILKHVVESADSQQTHPSLWFRDNRNHSRNAQRRTSKKAAAGSVVAIAACKPTAESFQTGRLQIRKAIRSELNKPG